ncbi:MAG TPA: hypothetical protein PLP56_07075 [Candidatus Omnitrophota bacterium]|nr:hypothetical protein [Candidatus Omnitrophota bacterium]HNQ50366.1 hypothetical protein [Candidatus Omnitrophota bacterium]HQO37738.1 hypothetical protein [Candidatus Omnitrophota bacterium]HQQ06721.1 hypothetical protein [Candidatus Omnitrophota bacterium]
MKRTVPGLISVLCIAMWLEGCFSSHYQNISLLKRFAKNQHGIQGYLDDREKSFRKLKDDILNDRLTRGTARQRIVAMYGEPLLCKPEGNGGAGRLRCLYRHPTQYFSSDKVYLTFDEEQKLDSWELRGARQ